MKRLLTLLVLPLALAAGCGEKDQAKSAGQDPGGDLPGMEVVSATTHDVICGCALEEVGKCGEYIKVEDAFLPIKGDLGLGPMPFCGKEDLKAEVTGEVEGGEYVASSLKLLN